MPGAQTKAPCVVGGTDRRATQPYFGWACHTVGLRAAPNPPPVFYCRHVLRAGGQALHMVIAGAALGFLDWIRRPVIPVPPETEAETVAMSHPGRGPAMPDPD